MVNEANPDLESNSDEPDFNICPRCNMVMDGKPWHGTTCPACRLYITPNYWHPHAPAHITARGDAAIKLLAEALLNGQLRA